MHILIANFCLIAFIWLKFFVSISNYVQDESYQHFMTINNTELRLTKENTITGLKLVHEITVQFPVQNVYSRYNWYMYNVHTYISCALKYKNKIPYLKPNIRKHILETENHAFRTFLWRTRFLCCSKWSALGNHMLHTWQNCCGGMWGVCSRSITRAACFLPDLCDCRSWGRERLVSWNG